MGINRGSIPPAGPIRKARHGVWILLIPYRLSTGIGRAAAVAPGGA